jgi:hypothetical protein
MSDPGNDGSSIQQGMGCLLVCAAVSLVTWIPLVVWVSLFLK